MRRTPKRLSLWERFTSWLQRVVWFFKGEELKAQLAQVATPTSPASPIRTEAELAVERVVMETDITPDCINAQVLRGGCTILVKHNEAWEAFVHNSYGEAADKAIEWLKLQGDEIKTNKVTKLNRQQRRKFDAERKKLRRH